MWSLAGSRARFDSPRQSIAIDLAFPNAGIGEVSCAASAGGPARWEGAQLLQLLGPQWELSDAFVRGQEAVAAYQPIGEQRAFYRLAWHVLPAPAQDDSLLGGLELAISVHTDVLDSEPLLAVRSRLTAGPVSNRDGWFLYESPGSAQTYLEIIHPSNYHDSALHTLPNHEIEATHRFFPGGLEKGVIRLARLQSWFLAPAASDRAASLYQRIVESPPPLS